MNDSTKLRNRSRSINLKSCAEDYSNLGTSDPPQTIQVFVLNDNASSRINFRTISQTHISKREFNNGHISRFCSVFQVIQVILSTKFFSAEEVDLSFISETQEHPQISNPSFWKRDREDIFLQMFLFGEK